MKTILLNLFPLFFALSLSAQNDLRSIYNAGIEAYKAEDFKQFLYHFQRADSVSPDHPTITYNLAAAYAKNNSYNESLVYIKKAILMNTAFKPEEDEDFVEMLELPDFKELMTLREDLNKEIKSSAVAFSNSEKDLHPESVAFDPRSGDFFLNSVRKGKVVRYHAKTSSFTDFASGLWSVMGMKVYKNSLWVCTVATSEHENYSDKNEGKTALLQFDVKTGELLNRYELVGGHWFGDLVISKSGKILVSDSKAPIIYTLEENFLVEFVNFSDQLFNLQGLTFSADESTLYLSDYKIGLHAFNIQSKALSKLTFPDNLITKGVDGLYFYKNSLLAIHNGVKPFRVARYFLDPSGSKIISYQYIDKAREELNEPTLGVLIKNEFYYVSNSPWGAYKDGEFDQTGLGENIVLWYDLE